ncbi:abnormal spindle-like microcephaly-associated protein homolog [Dreissena polymorpha]|uniref:abnormal spindle-like microcephaly-associated protein homolog n=1 Tax=Dreissena polymorpha TaxID=45954 RepID=UPI002264D1BF|nr:abnormal spindle-like microcephaly-associated protein homolog [Dreissena polymorpha]XP_052220934.1 abnormal spindle-like microcephaly-associated protein homolog [Dreissena polymorpha]XP_052220935.1 abnormal spindle-like microcephaly-associated protein homolog [Dreissena polymorpha]
MSGVSIVSEGGLDDDGVAFEFSMLDQGVSYPADMAGLPTSTPNLAKLKRRSRKSWFDTPNQIKYEIAVESPHATKPVRRKSENMEVLTLTHFTAPPRLGFGTMKLGQEKMCILMLRNPHDYEQHVRVEKVPEKKHFTVNCREMVVGPEESFPLEITWSPKEAGGVREMVLLHIDSSYRLQAYVFGTVTEPPKKKKTKRVGLLASKVAKPFSVIHTASLANIDKQYSPEKQTTKPAYRPGKMATKAPTARNHAVNSKTMKVKGVSCEPIIQNVIVQKEIEKMVKRQSTEKLTNSFVSKEAAIPRKKMRRSNTYSNVSGIGLVVPIIHNEEVTGHRDTSLLKVGECDISGLNVLETSDNNVNVLPSFMKVKQEVDSEPSFMKNFKSRDGPKSNVIQNSQPSFLDDDGCSNNLEPSFLMPCPKTLKHVKLEDSFQDSLDIKEDQENVKPEEPSFLQSKDKLKSLRRSGRLDKHSELNVLRSIKKNQREGGTNKKRRSSDGNSVLKQLKNLKTFIHEKSLEIEENCANLSLERSETFATQTKSPRFSMVATGDIRRGTFVTDPAKIKLLEDQKPSQASPRRTTFTVLKTVEQNVKRTASTIHTGTLNEEEDEVISNIGAIERALKANKNNIVHDEQNKEPKLERMYSADSLDNNSLEEKFGSAQNKEPKLERMYSADSLDNNSLEEKFGSATEIVTEPTENYSRRATLTVTKSHPSEALIQHHAQKSGAVTSLFRTAKKNPIECIQEEDASQSQHSAQNSTFEVSAEESVLLKDADFQPTPVHLPTSPLLNLSRRSTHVVLKPQVVNITGNSGIQVIKDAKNVNSDHSIINARMQSESAKTCTEIIPYIVPEITEDIDVFSPPSANTRRRTLSARRSLGKKIEHDVSQDSIACENASNVNKPYCPEGDVLSLFFIPVDKDNVDEQVKKRVHKAEPKQFLKKRSNPCTQEVDQRTKRVCNDKTTVADTKSNMATTVIQRKPGSTSSQDARQPVKPKTSIMKGLAQSKLILTKKSKSVIPKHPLAFAAKNMYYDERWIEKQERGFVNWLNFILTPADENKGSDVKVKVDAGKLAIDVEKGRGQLAPTNEILSFRTYAAHRKLNRLRKCACKLFQSDAVRHVIHKLEREVESGRLLVRKDKMLHADLGAKQRVLDMLLSYNPLWLRIGLETIYGEVVMLQSNTDVYGLSRFVITRLLSSPDIAQAYAHPTVPHLYRDGYGEASAQHTLKKFLMLVYFLDQAKQQRLIDHNPCLFCKNSEFKASKDLLLQISRDFLSGEGDITRHLGYLGYKVTYTQTALDEFDFAVKKLAVDLRDGVRLTRVMEMLCDRRDLSASLRMPAISKLQKVHNMKLVFKVLTDQQVDTGKASPGDIVEGHREHTLQLLWHMILHFQVTLLVNMDQLREEVRLLERSLHIKHRLIALAALKPFEKEIRRDSIIGDLHTQDNRLNLLLQWCRAVCAHFDIKVENFTVSFSDGRALCHIVHFYHPGLLPLGSIAQQTTVSHLEELERRGSQDCSLNDSTSSAAVFGEMQDPEVFEKLINNDKENFKLLSEKVKELGGVPMMLHWSDMSNTIPDEKVVVTYLLYLCARLLDIRHESRAARLIQHAWRAYQMRKRELELKEKTNAVMVMQRAVRAFLKSRRQARQNAAALSIQKVWRGYKDRKLAKQLRMELAMQEQISAVKLLQVAIKRYLFRRQFLQMKASIINVQACCRGYLYRKAKCESATTIQRVYRGYKARKELSWKTAAVAKIQAFFRGFLVRKHLKKSSNAARVIQCWYRAQTAMKKDKLTFQSLKQSSIAVQRFWRGLVETRTLRKEFLSLRAAVLKIQASVRGQIQRSKYQRMKVAAIVIQSHVRSWRVQKAYRVVLAHSHAAAMMIQAAFRGHMVRKQLQSQHRAATVIQARFKAFAERKRFQKLVNAVCTCQQLYRAKCIGTVQRQEFLLQKQAAVKIQSHFRKWKSQRHFKACKQAAVQLQAWFRCHRAQHAFKRCRTAAMVIQLYWRATISGRRQFDLYQKQKNAAIKIQSAYRGSVCKRKYLSMHSATVTIQAQCRGYLYRKQRHNAALTIQRIYRGHIVRKVARQSQMAAMKVQAYYRMCLARQKFNMLRKAASIIQSRVRAHVAMRAQQQTYTSLKRSCIVIQKFWRGLVKTRTLRKEFLAQRAAVLKIQASVRGQIQRSKYQRMKVAAIVIQSHVRSWRVQKAYRVVLAHSHAAAMMIQAAFRGHMVRKQLQSEHRAATVIQARFKAFAERNRFQKLKAATVLCQQVYRANLAGKLQRKSYLKVYSSVLFIQSQFRMLKSRKQFVTCKKAAVKIQSMFKGQLARQRYLQYRNAAHVLQKHWRARVACAKLSSAYQSQRLAAIRIQSAIRRLFCRQKYLMLRSAAVKIQAVCRGWLFRKKRLNAAVTVQRLYRGYMVRKCFQQKKIAARKIQAHFRRYQAVQNFKACKVAAITIQSKIKAHLAMKRQRDQYENMKKSCINLQRRWRGYLITKELRGKFLQQRAAAVRIQSYARKMIHRSHYLKLRSAAIVIQSYIRTCRVRRAYKVLLEHSHSAATAIQATFRGYKVRKQKCMENNAATVIQTLFRKWYARNAYQNLRKAVILCQVRVRAKQHSKLQRRKFLLIKAAAVIIQAKYKMIQQRKKYLKERKAAITIQAWYRGHVARSQYQIQHSAACILQRHWRAELACRGQVLQYHRLRDAVMALQARHRGNLARHHTARIRAAIKIQAFIRMVLFRSDYRKIRSSAVKIQGQIRMYRARQVLEGLRETRLWEREVYLTRVAVVIKVHLAAARIQRSYRKHRVMTLAKERLHCILIIQNWMRSQLERVRYLRTVERLRKLQACVRSWIARRDFAARLIQKAVKRWLAEVGNMRKRKAAIKLQSMWRGHCVRRDSTSRQVALVRARVRVATAAATEEKKLANRTTSALDFLLRYKHLSQVQKALMDLDVATRLSWMCCERIVATNAISVLYRLLQGCNRSVAHMDLIKYTISVLLNLAKYEKTRGRVSSEEGGLGVLVELMSIYREKVAIFTKLCTLLGILSLDMTCKQAIMEDKKCVEKLRSIQALTARKHKLEETQRVTKARINSTLNSTLMIRSPVKKQKIKPDWSLQKDKMQDFDSPLKAINFVLGNLGIQTKC